MRVNEIDDTPRVIIDLDILEKNIKDIQQYCDTNGFKLRPHIKTHKIPEIANMQIKSGAVGIACQKVGEAEEMVAAGIKDVLIYYNIIGNSKLERLASLAKLAKISVAIDSEQVLNGIQNAAEKNGCIIGILIDCDTGFHRTGVQSPTEALRLSKIVMQSKSLRFEGLSTYPFKEQSVKWFQECEEIFLNEGIDIPSISGGSSASTTIAHKTGHISELRMGTYVFYDRTFVQMGIASYEQCAQRVISTIVSCQSDSIRILDAGSKTLTNDRGYNQDDGFGYIVEYPQAKIFLLSEEHGHVDFSECNDKPQIGEQVTIIPNHACGTMNLHDEALVVRNGAVEAIWKVAARGRVR